MPPDDLLLVGRFARPHGVHGDVKAIPETDDPARLADLRNVFVGPAAASARPARLAALRAVPSKQGGTLVVRLDGVTTPEGAEALRGLGLYVRAADLPLADGEYFLHDRVGLAVEDEAGVPLGVVRDVVDLPSHPVFVVERPGRPDVLVPDVPVFVVALDVPGRRLVVRPIEGLFDDDAETA